MQQKITKIIAILLVAVMLYMSAGTVIAYAAESLMSENQLESQGIATNSANVEFDAYYEGGNHKKTVDITSAGTKIYLKVSVKNVGYLDNATINFSNSNFEIENDDSNKEKIQVFDEANKKIVLNRILAGEEVIIVINAKFKYSNVIAANYFNTDNSIELLGNYTSDKAKETAIKKSIVVNLAWHAEPEVEVTQNVNKYLPYNIDNESGLLIQSVVESSIVNNLVPVKKTTITVSSPKIANENPKKVVVFANKTASTNGKEDGLEFSDLNYTYDNSTGIITIKVENEVDENGNVMWVKGQDEFYITYIYSENVYGSVKDIATEVSTKAKVECEYYNDIEYTSSKTVNKSSTYKETLKSNDLQVNILNEEIQKGNLYTNKVTSNDKKSETEFDVKYTANVSYSKLQDQLLIDEIADNFVKNEGNEINASVYDKRITVNKKQIEKVLGSNGKLDIISNEKTIATILSTDNADENGNIVVNLEKDITNISIKTSSPENEGQIAVTVGKAISKDLTSNNEEIQLIKSIKVTSNLTTKLGDKTEEQENVDDIVNFIEPTLKAHLELVNNNLSTTTINENVEMKVILDTNTEKDMLFSNPTIEIELPSYISEVVLKDNVSLLHSDELSISSKEVVDTENGKSIIIKINGTQTRYSDEVTSGVTILLYANLKVTGLTENITADINMKYSNENSLYGDENITKTVKSQIQFVAPITESETNNVIENETNQNIEDNNSSTTKEITETTNEGLIVTTKAISGNKELSADDTVYEGQTVEYQITLQNKTGKDINNLKIVGKNTNAIYYDLIGKIGTYQQDGQMVESEYHFFTEMTDWTEKDFDTITLLKNNETTTLEYQIVVKEVEGDENQTQGTLTINANEIEEEATIKTVSNKIKQADLKINQKCGFAIEDPDVNVGTRLPIEITIKNLTDTEISNATMDCVLSKGLTTDTNGIYIADENENNNYGYEFVSMENNDLKLKLDTLEPNEERKIKLFVWATKDMENNSVSMITNITTDNNNVYISNNLERNINEYVDYGVEIKQSANIPAGTVLKTGDNLIYTFKIKNVTENITIASFLDKLPNGLNVNKVTLIKNGVDTNITNESVKYSDKIVITYTDILLKNEEVSIIIDTTVNKALAIDKKVENIGNVDILASLVDSNSISYNVEENIEEYKNVDNNDENNGGNNNNGNDDNDDGNNKGDNNNNNNNDNNNDDNNGGNTNTDEKYTISGTAWFDANENSSKDPKEMLLSNINVMLINSETGKLVEDSNGNTVQVKTDENGKYEIKNVTKGKYIVVFQFDSQKYTTTEYEKTGISNEDNSNVIEKNATIDGKEAIIGVTNTLIVKETNIENINIGLISREKFDLSLDKVITKITVKNDQGTTVYDIDNKKAAKVEVSDKYLAESTIIVEYKISIKNEGNVAGYARDIVDYLPEGMKFNSELNKEWYQSNDGNIHTNSLENTLINVGETKDVTITLIKTMNTASAETVANDAEISESRSVTLQEDVDSTAANKVSTEDDMSTAKLIISIKTGTAQIYAITLVVLCSSIGIAIIIKKNKEEV